MSNSAVFRRFVWRALVALALLAGANAVRAADLLAELGAQLEQSAVIRADFVQTKQMAALKRPLVTRGHLIFSRSQGVVWQIEQPYRISYLLGETRIVEIAGDGARRVREARDVPGLAQVGRVFRALLGANSAALREYFDVAVRGDAAHWAVELKPRQAQLAQFLTAMQLSGGRFVDEIRISEASGDTTQIRFTDTQGAAALSDAESALFGDDAVRR